MFVRPSSKFDPDFNAKNIGKAFERDKKVDERTEQVSVTIFKEKFETIQTHKENPLKDYLQIRQDSAYRMLISTALKELRGILQVQSDDEIQKYHTVFFCIESSSFRKKFEYSWLTDLKKDLNKLKFVSVKINTETPAGVCPAETIYEYCQGQNLPDLLLTFGSKGLDKERKKGEEAFSMEYGKEWVAAIEGMKIKQRKKIIPVVISGMGQSFWPHTTKFNLSLDNVMPLLVEYPVVKKEYHVLLFQIIRELCCGDENRLERHDQIVERFNQTLKEKLEKNNV